ncbi:MAG: ATP-binding cassette domain-containing protein, partial [Acidimicrobiales bacterium]
SGITTRPQMSLGFVTVQSKLQWYVVALVLTAVVVAVLAWAVAGKRGRILRLVRHDQLAAEVLGVPVQRVKLLAFVLGAALAGVAGALLFASQGLVDPASASVLTSVQLAMLVVIGGPGYRMGGLVGAFVVLWLQDLLNSSGNYELLVYGAVLLAVVFFLRAGLEGSVADLWSRLIGRRPGPAREKAEAAPGAEGRTLPGAAPAERGAAEGLEVRSARRSFGGVAAVDGVSIVAPAGKVTALVGANGAGKSTLLNLISGVERLEGGSVSMDGEDMSHASPAERTRRGIVRTFQVPRLVDELPVVQNVVLGREAAEHSAIRRRRGVERSELARARATLAELSLQHLADRPARALGTGERKYAELARAMFADAAVILLDEPAVGLSMEEVARLRRWLAQMRDRGTAVVVIDHNIDFIKELADYVYSMESGRIVWEGAPGDLPLQVTQPLRLTREAQLGDAERASASKAAAESPPADGSRR